MVDMVVKMEDHLLGWKWYTCVSGLCGKDFVFPLQRTNTCPVCDGPIEEVPEPKFETEDAKKSCLYDGV